MKQLIRSIIVIGISIMLTTNAFAATSVYTGLPITDELANMRSIAIMMPTDAVAQPSYGIGKAAILYEIMGEGNISRQMAVIPNWKGMDRIGNIRSCRRYYTDLCKEWDSILVHFGGVVYMKGFIDTPDIDNISGVKEYGTGGEAPGAGQFFRSDDRTSPHNAYISSAGIEKAAQQNKYDLTISSRKQYYNTNHFKFGKNNLENGSVANKIDLSNIFPYTKTGFRYDETKGDYAKTIHLAPHIDGIDKRQLHFNNIIIQSTDYNVMDSKGYLDVYVVGSGSGWFCTKGKMIPITWVKSSAHSPTIYMDKSKNVIEFNPGKTYIAIAQKGKVPSFSK